MEPEMADFSFCAVIMNLLRQAFLTHIKLIEIFRHTDKLSDDTF